MSRRLHFTNGHRGFCLTAAVCALSGLLPAADWAWTGPTAAESAAGPVRPAPNPLWGFGPCGEFSTPQSTLVYPGAVAAPAKWNADFALELWACGPRRDGTALLARGGTARAKGAASWALWVDAGEAEGYGRLKLGLVAWGEKHVYQTELLAWPEGQWFQLVLIQETVGWETKRVRLYCTPAGWGPVRQVFDQVVLHHNYVGGGNTDLIVGGDPGGPDSPEAPAGCWGGQIGTIRLWCSRLPTEADLTARFPVFVLAARAESAP